MKRERERERKRERERERVRERERDREEENETVWVQNYQPKIFPNFHQRRNDSEYFESDL